jgi:hypothetical protein
MQKVDEKRLSNVHFVILISLGTLCPAFTQKFMLILGLPLQKGLRKNKRCGLIYFC